MTTPITVALIDDHTVVRDAIARMIEAADDLHVVGQAGSLGEAREARLAEIADVLVVDVSLPDGNGLDLVRSVRRENQTIGMVVLTMHRDDDVLLGALDAGASGLVLKSDASDAVLAGIRQAYASPRSFAASGLADALRRQKEAPIHLTPREREVLTHLVDGKSVDEVAKTLYMSRSTVKTHVGKLYDKLDVRNRASLTMEAIRLGLVRSQQANASPGRSSEL